MTQVSVRIGADNGRLVIYGHGVMGTPFHRYAESLEAARTWCLAQCVELMGIDPEALAIADELCPDD